VRFVLSRAPGLWKVDEVDEETLARELAMWCETGGNS
jgi:hypothetical protein